MREIRTLRVMRRGLETELWRHFGATAPVPDLTTRHKDAGNHTCDVLDFLEPALPLRLFS